MNNNKTYKNFLFRLINIIFIVIIIIFYNQFVFLQNELSKANETIETIAEMQTSTQVVSTQDKIIQNAKYKDGVYEGDGKGFGGKISLRVMVENDMIKTIEVISAKNEDAAYFDMAKVLFETIIEKQDSQVDAVSGATFSSNGIIEAVEQALEKAVTQ